MAIATVHNIHISIIIAITNVILTSSRASKLHWTETTNPLTQRATGVKCGATSARS